MCCTNIDIVYCFMHNVNTCFINKCFYLTKTTILSNVFVVNRKPFLRRDKMKQNVVSPPGVCVCVHALVQTH